jgi:hypothetical protein
MDTDYFTVLDDLFELAAPKFGPNGTCRLGWYNGIGATYRIATSTNLLSGYILLATTSCTYAGTDPFWGLTRFGVCPRLQQTGVWAPRLQLSYEVEFSRAKGRW